MPQLSIPAFEFPAATNGSLLRYAQSLIEADAYGSPTHGVPTSPRRVQHVLSPVTYVSSPRPVILPSAVSRTSSPRRLATEASGLRPATPSTRSSPSSQAPNTPAAGASPTRRKLHFGPPAAGSPSPRLLDEGSADTMQGQGERGLAALAAPPAAACRSEEQALPKPSPPETLATPLLPKDPELGTITEGPEELPEMAQPWGRFAALWLCCTLASGILPGQALFANQFAEAGVFGSMCGKQGTCKDQYLALTGFFGVGQSLAYGFLAPIGLLYDRYGAMAVGTSGALTCAIGPGGLCLVTASCVGAAAGMDAATSWLFVAGVFTCDFGSILNSFSVLGLIWHFPRSQTLLIALINATYQASALLPLMLQAGMDATGAPLSVFMGLWSLVVGCTVLACYKLIPTQTEFYDQAKRVLGMPLPKPPTDMKVCEMLKRAGRVLAQCKKEHIASSIALALGFGLPGYYASMTAPYGAALFGHKADGERLAELNVICTSIVGLALGPFTGTIGDKFGLKVIVYLFVAIMGLSTLTMGLASWPAQAFTAGSMSLFLCLFTIFLNRYLLLYSPPNRFGAVQGVYAFGVVLLSTPCSLGGIAATAALPPGVDAYRIPMMVFGASGFFGLALYAAYFRSHPPPEVPPILPEDEAELVQGFGCTTLEEVMEVTNTSRQELLKTLSSTKPEDIRSLMRRIDRDKMMEIMSRRSVGESAVQKHEALLDPDLPETAQGG